MRQPSPRELHVPGALQAGARGVVVLGGREEVGEGSLERGQVHLLAQVAHTVLGAHLDTHSQG
jgi:hypothetical protein